MQGLHRKRGSHSCLEHVCDCLLLYLNLLLANHTLLLPTSKAFIRSIKAIIYQEYLK